jgi:hypothetical protein
VRRRLAFVAMFLAIYLTPFPFMFALSRFLHQWPLPSELQVIFYNIENIIVLSAALCYGLVRVSVFHPLRNQQYLAWLRSTPWTAEKPLPLGPLHLGWQDLFIILFLTSLVSWTHPINPVFPAVAVVLAFSLTLLFANLTIESVKRSAPWEPFITACILPLLIIFWQIHWVWYAISAIVYVLEQSHLRKVLRILPWILKEKMPTISVDWPWSRIGPVEIAPPIAWMKMFRISILFSWWIFAIFYTAAAPLHDPVMKDFMCSMPIVAGGAATLGRLLAYCNGRPPPIGFFGRLFTDNFLLPRYDIIFMGPLYILICAAIFICCLNPLSARVDVSDFAIFSAGIGAILFVAFKAPPSIRRWTLTGGYRLQPGSRRQRANAMQFQRKSPFLRTGSGNSLPL